MCHLKDNVGNAVYTHPPNDVYFLYSKFYLNVVLFRHPKGGICLFVMNVPQVIQTPKTNDLQLALDYLCKRLVILNNVYLPLVELLLLLFCGQDSWPSPFKSSWGSLYIGRVTNFINLWSISNPLSDGLGSCLGVGMMVGEGWVLVSF